LSSSRGPVFKFSSYIDGTEHCREAKRGKEKGGKISTTTREKREGGGASPQRGRPVDCDLIVRNVCIGDKPTQKYLNRKHKSDHV